MATLHVRNVPEPLYELLRACAERDGRSIGAETVVLLQGALVRSDAAREQMRSLISPPRGSAIQRFGAPARDVVRRAQAAARALNRKAVGTEHLLVALAEVGHAELDPDDVRAQLTRGRGRSPRKIPFDESAKQALELALRESLATRSRTIEIGHLLVGVLLAGGRGGEILRERGVDLEGLRATLIVEGGHAVAPWAREEREYLAVDLEGSADAWTDRLNELAADGWELLQLVDGRAILRRA